MGIICKNCGTVTNGDYCHNCGQRTSVSKVTFKETIQDFIEAVFSVNSPLLLTLKFLIINPGKLFREYLSGKRKMYYKPVPFFLLVTLIFVIVRALINYNPMENMAVVENDILDENLIKSAGVFMAKNINNIIFTFVFSFAIVTKLFFFKKYLFAEYLAISFYIIGFYIIATIVFMFGLKYVNPQYKMAPFIFMLFYINYALISFFQMRSMLIIMKIFFLYFISLFLYIVIGYGLSFMIVWLKS